MDLTKLFESKLISLDEIIVKDKWQYFIAYNEDLLRKKVLIEFNEDKAKNGDPETLIRAVYREEYKTYFFMLSLEYKRLIPLDVLGLVQNSIEYMSKCGCETLLKDLEDIAVGVNICWNGAMTLDHYRRLILNKRTRVAI